MNDIKFGTDGWRGLIARDYTWAGNARRVETVAEKLTAEKLRGAS